MKVKDIISVAGQAAQNFVNSQFNIYGVKEVKIDFYDGINTICPFVCPTCNKPTLMTKCPNCGQLLEFPKMAKSEQ